MVLRCTPPSESDAGRPGRHGVMPGLADLHDEIRTHHGCGFEICEAATNLVPGEGDADADVMLVGEAPGRQEDEQGRPFCGRAGQLLDEALAEAGLPRERGVHHQRRQGAPAAQPRPDGGRGRALDAGARGRAGAGRPAARGAAGAPRAGPLRAGRSRSARSTGGCWSSAAARCTRSTTRPPRCARRSCARRSWPTRAGCRQALASLPAPASRARFAARRRRYHPRHGTRGDARGRRVPGANGRGRTARRRRAGRATTPSRAASRWRPP